MSVLSRRLLCALILLLWLPGAARAEIVPDLYVAEAIVTGRDNLPERERGFQLALVQALVKVSGDARLAEDARVQAMIRQAAGFVESFAYEDRHKKQINDEQGTRDRSYHLRVQFRQGKIDEALTQLGGTAWTADRPRILALLVVYDSVGAYLLGHESERGYGQRESFKSIAERRGVPLILPRMDAAERAATDPDKIATFDHLELSQLAGRYAADAVLAGTMRLTPQGYWRTDWALAHGDRIERWTFGEATFDRAIGAGLGRTVLRLAGIE